MKNTILLTACCLLLGLGRTSVLVAQQVQTFPKRSTRLYVRTIPPGADIKLDGHSRGTSDRLFKVPPGVRKMTVEVELDGHYPKQQTVRIQGGRITRVELELEESPQPPATFIPLPSVMEMYGLKSLGWRIQDDYLTGRLGDTRTGSKFPWSTRAYEVSSLEFGFKMKAKWYHWISMNIDDNGLGVSRGHWFNKGTMFWDGFLHKEVGRRLTGPIVTSPDQWASLTATLKDDTVRFYYNGELQWERKIPARPDGRHRVSPRFLCHNATVCVKDFYVKLDPGATVVDLPLKKRPEQAPVNPFKERPDWGADQATGPPDTPRAGDLRTAWASLTADGQQEWLVLEYLETVKPAEIQVYESHNPGAISKITVFDPGGKEVEIEKPSPKGKAIDGGVVVSKFPVKVDFPVRRVKLYLDSPEIKGWNEIDAVGLVDAQGRTHWAAKAEASSTFADRRSGGFVVTPPPPEGKIPEGAVQLSHVDDTAEGKKSLGGSGQAVIFERPADAKHVAAIQIFASRYGYPKPPNEGFHVYLLDQDQKVIKDLTYPYSMIERGAERWYTLAVPSVEVPEKFHVALSFNAHRTKGVYVGINEGVEETHSLIGLPDRGYKPVTEGYDWMVRVYLVSDAQAIKSEPAVGGDDEDAVAGFDPAPVFRRNRPWQNPELDHLQSVQFVHHMEPILLDERFIWRGGLPIKGQRDPPTTDRADATALLEVVAREDEHAAKEIGRRWVTTSEPAQYYRSPSAKHYTSRPKSRDELANYFRNHLMGTQANFVAVDWGRDPSAFAVADLHRNPDEKQLTVTLAPRQRKYHVNVGAMFQTTSWAYVHHLRVAKSEITIDTDNHRILREVDRDRNGAELLRLEFTDWLDVGNDQSVPQAIHAHVPRSNFDVTYQFQWLPERLWILKTGQARFNKGAPQREEIRELKINQPTPELETALAEVAKSKQYLEGGEAVETESRVLTVHPFQFGKRVSLTDPAPDGSAFQVRDFLFTMDQNPQLDGYRYSLFAELGVAGDAKQAAVDDRIVLALYDESRRVLSTFEAPLAAPPDANRPASKIVDPIRDHNAAWLTPEANQMPKLSYAVRGEKRRDQVKLDESSNAHARRGIILNLGLDRLLNSPERFRVPVLFEGIFNEKEVIVAIVTGRYCGMSWEEGISAAARGRQSSWGNVGQLVLEKDTFRPLIAIYGNTEIHFLNYVEVRPGVRQKERRQAPLRMIIWQDEHCWDFRFQIVEEAVWLLDRLLDDAGRVIVEVEDLVVASGQEAAVRRAEEVALLEEIRPLDWSSITGRRSLHSPENPLVEEIIASRAPSGHPYFKALQGMQVSVEDGTPRRRIAMNLNGDPMLRDARYWSLGLFASGKSSNDREASSDGVWHPVGGAEKLEVPTYPLQKDEWMSVDVSDGPKGTTRITRIRFEEDSQGRLSAKVKLLSRAHGTAFTGLVSAVLLDDNNATLAAATAAPKVRVKSEVVDEEVVLQFGKPAGRLRPKRLFLSLKTRVTGRMTGSGWYGEWPTDGSHLFPIDRLLAAEDPRAWKVGLKILEDLLRRNQDENVHTYLERCEVLLKKTDHPECLALLCRLIGRSGEKRLIDSIAPLLSDPRPIVRDGAAVGLGFLGDARGADRLVEILQSPFPEDAIELSSRQRDLGDVVLALGTLGTEEGLHAMGETFLRVVDRITVTPGGNRFEGPTLLGYGLAKALGNSGNPLVLDYLLKVIKRGDHSKVMDQTIARGLPRFHKDLAQPEIECPKVVEVYRAGIRRGRHYYLSNAPVTPVLVSEVGEMILKEGLNSHCFMLGVEYLKRANDPAALKPVREAFQQGLHSGYDDGRRALAAALLSYDDLSGLDAAFGLLRRLQDSSTLPKDGRQKAKQQRRRKRTLEKVAPLFALKSVSETEYVPPPELAEFLAPRLQSDDKLTRSAALTVAESLPAVPDDLKSLLQELVDHADTDVATRAKQLVEKSK